MASQKTVKSTIEALSGPKLTIKGTLFAADGESLTIANGRLQQDILLEYVINRQDKELRLVELI